MEDCTVLGLAAIIAGLGVGFGTALISFWWNYKTRGLSHQQFLYQKQIEAYPRVLASIANVMQPCYDFLLVHHNVLTTEDREKMRLEVEKLLQEHTLGLDRDLVLLPSEVIRSINKLNGTLRDLTTYGTTERAVDGRIMVVQIADPSGALGDAHLRVINAIREEARIETLSKMDWIVGPRRPGTNEFDDWDRWEACIAAEAAKAALQVVKPYFQAEKAAKAGKVHIATVEGDLHDIGKNLVVVLAEASGFEVHDLGVDVPPETFAENTRKLRPDFLGMSSLLSTTVPKFKETVDTLNKEGLRETVKVIIGGVSASQAIADEYRIDAYAADAVAGVRRISRWKTEQT